MVAGASGFLGRHVGAALERRGHQVLEVSRSGLTGTQLDVTDAARCASIIADAGPDAVINLAGAGVTAGSASDDEMARANREGPANLASASVAAGARLLHVASSTEPLPGALPESVYSQTKAEGTARIGDLMRAHPGYLSVARVHNAYGVDQPAGRFIIDLIHHMRAGADFTVRFPERVRDFCPVDEVAGVLADLAEDPLANDRWFDIGTTEGVTLLQAALMVRDLFGASAAQVQWAEGSAADPAPSSVAGDAGMETLACPTTLARGLEALRREFA